MTSFRKSTRRILKNKLSALSFLGIMFLVGVAVVGPYVSPHPEDAAGVARLSERLKPPSPEFRLGTDEMGRDILSRVILGVRISLSTSLIVVAVAASIGTAAGLIAGYFGGWADEIIMRVTDAFLSIPSLVLALAVGASMGPGLFNAQMAIALVWWPWYARLVRSQVLGLRNRDFVEAANAVGALPIRVITRHILPNCMAPIMVQASLDMGYVLLTAASLGFLGLGAQPPTAEWGLMVSSGRQFFPRWWWVSTYPGLAIFVTVLLFNLAGDGVRDILDPRLRR
ncbi:MAG: nickel transporter permease [Ignavibacteriales bacterium]